ncbi:hypothetical protein DFH07DRAFT_521031 [Mycena maculata]|uniref:MYND-type domain-containing protein n=1 Tax=Mycena maculata TaxID=230809 RepID=A0AAD7J0E2_9AGAR|nr:hypothetical protein DFH07DRAFT_521031 [Mycena maculata]
MPSRRFKPSPPDFGPERSDPKCKEFEANNLRHPKNFPAYKHCAPYRAYSKNEEDQPSHHWCYLGEIMVDESSPFCVVLGVKDKDGEYVRVAFYFDDNNSFDYKSVKIGSTIAVMYAEKHNFLDGSYGLRLEHPKFVKIFPCKLETLLRINDDIESETPVDCSQKCKACGKEEHPDEISLLRCSRCLGASYCGKECQMDAWNAGHKRECKVFIAVNDLKRSRDWRSYNIYAEPLEWVAFGQREKSLKARDERLTDPYRVNPEWKDAEPAVSAELQGSFTVTSGELIWGQLASVLEGLVNPAHDQPTPA